jgi:reactive intermediate/imine deaminase
MRPHCLLALFLVACSSTGHRHFNPPDRSDTNPFAHGVLAGDTYYVAGTLGLDPATGQPPADAAQEAKLVMDGIQAKLALADMTMEDVVSVQVFCPDLTLYDTFNNVYRTYFEDGFPARAFIGSGPLLRGARFEVNAIAVR